MKDEIGHGDLVSLGAMLIVLISAVAVMLHDDAKLLEKRVYALEHRSTPPAGSAP